MISFPVHTMVCRIRPIFADSVDDSCPRVTPVNPKASRRQIRRMLILPTNRPYEFVLTILVASLSTRNKFVMESSDPHGETCQRSECPRHPMFGKSSWSLHASD